MGASPIPTLEKKLFSQPRRQFRQGAYAHARGALFLVRLLAIQVAGAGDIQVRPLRVTHEVHQNLRRRHRRGITPTSLLDIGDVALDSIAVLVIQWHGPELLASRATCCYNL